MRERVARLVIVVLWGLFLMGPPYLGGDAAILAQGTEAPGNAVAAGELLVEPPTLINLGFEWSIEGDDNRNASVEVAYRRQGETEWSPALPLLRLQRERIFVGNQFDVVVPNMFAGSILDLEPDTAYEARFVMTDPDGVIGEAKPDRDRADAGRAGAVRGGEGVPRLSPRLRG